MLLLKMLLPVFLTTSLASAGVVKKKPRVQIFTNTSCSKNTSCSLQEFKLQTVDYRVDFTQGGTSFGTDAHISYKTRKVSDLEDYAVVQFIRGCKFSSMRTADNKINKFIMARDYFGKMSAFKHPQWSIDSIDTDPMYNNGPEKKRHAYYRWKKGADQVYYFQEKPSTPELYTTDLPGTASMTNPDDIATNISLQFKVCLYRTEDVPLQAGPQQIDFARPLKCFDWASSYIYNHDLNKFESKKEIDPFCQEE